MVGEVMWELIEPLDDESVYARFLAERAKVCTTSPSPLRTSTTRWRRRLRRATAWSSAGSSAAPGAAYLPTDRDLGVIIEIFSCRPSADQKPEATYRDAAAARGDHVIHGGVA
jgi:methylmalonyl-CoA/ethylmalonyl-CoA epimerase